MPTPIGWLQLWHRPRRLAVALCGIAFAVLLILMQLGFRAALFESAVRYHERFDYDIALFSADSVYVPRPHSFSIRRLYQARGNAAVIDVTPVYIAQAVWKNPWNHDSRNIFAVGFNPDDALLNTPDFKAIQSKLRLRDAVLFDTGSRPEFGPVTETLNQQDRLVTEINDREMNVVGVFKVGSSFGLDGSIITSDDNWHRLFPDRTREDIQLGLIRLVDRADVNAVRDSLRAALPGDVLVMTRADFIARETAYWNSATPIGYIFAFGAVMGFVVGAIIVYQILFADVSEHRSEYATLRAIGYSNGFISAIVIQQALILGVLGYIPGTLLVIWLYSITADATNLPMYLTMDRGVTVLLMTVGMCVLSGLLATRKVRRLDPAEVF